MILRHTDIGAGPPVVLLHARPADRTQWEQVASLLAAAGYRAIAPDLPGYGESPPTEAGPVAPWEDVRETMDQLDVREALLVGNSLGAQTALQLAAARPERVNGLCVMGYRRHDQPPSPRLQQAWDEQAKALSRNDLDAAVAFGVRAWMSPSAKPSETETLANALHRNLTRRDTPENPEEAPDPLDEPDWAARVTMPVIILHGADDMPDFAEGATKLRDTLNTPAITIVPDAGHLIPLEQPTTVAIRVLQMLRGARE